ncbi:hypothetical protein MFUL124B02_02440 [Myxococcus fulvus 124B02]|nr:hypothetical protein MFUL124B02_02440 [Myxococcus fulvus 124B02]
MKRITSVWLREMDSSSLQSSDSHLRRAIEKACGGAKEGKPCHFQGHSFMRLECAGGFLLYSADLKPDRKQLQESCDRFSHLYE